MKKFTLLTILSLLLFNVLSAQVITSGSRIIGGTIGLGFNSMIADTLASSGSSMKGKNHSVLLSPSYGKAIKENLVFGYTTRVGYTHSESEDLRLNQIGKGSSWQLGAGVFLERFFPLGKDFSLSGRAAFDVNYSSSTNKAGSNTNHSTSVVRFYGVGVNASPAINYSFNKKLLMQVFMNDFIGLNYNYGTNEFRPVNAPAIKQSISNVDFTASINFGKQLSNLSFGFRYIF